MASWKRAVWIGAGLSVVAALAAFAVYEHRNSHVQAALWLRVAQGAQFTVEAGASDAIRFPGNGPYDVRLGYHQLPGMLERLQQRDYAITQQARMSPRLLELSDHGLFPAYREKSQAGLQVRDCRAESLLQQQRTAARVPAVRGRAALLVDALLFVEDQHLLDAQPPRRNPAVDTQRFAKAAFEQAYRMAESGPQRHRRQHAGHPDREVPPFARRPHRLGHAKSCARWRRPRCAPTWTARTPARGAARSSSTTSTRCRWRRARVRRGQWPGRRLVGLVRARFRRGQPPAGRQFQRRRRPRRAGRRRAGAPGRGLQAGAVADGRAAPADLVPAATARRWRG